MIHSIPYRAAHMLALRIQPAQAWLVPLLTDTVAREMEGPHSYTLMDDDTPLACVGVFRIWEDRAFLWSVISADIGPRRFLVATKQAVRFLEALPFRRIEAAVDVDFAQGHRWARLTGFVCEAERMRAFQVDGSDCALYARVKAVV